MLASSAFPEKPCPLLTLVGQLGRQQLGKEGPWMRTPRSRSEMIDPEESTLPWGKETSSILPRALGSCVNCGYY